MLAKSANKHEAKLKETMLLEVSTMKNLNEL
jgi:hypothetical protein